MLGDDILIGDPRLGEEYRKVISLLGVEVSQAKTYVSSGMCEFAKRYLFLGEEVTPFSLASVRDSRGNPSLLVASMVGESRKGLVPLSGIPAAVGTYLHQTVYLRYGGIPRAKKGIQPLKASA